MLAGVGGACKLFLAAGARTSVEGGERMAAALARAPGRGLVTVSNHVGSVDDPLITSSSERRGGRGLSASRPLSGSVDVQVVK